jgi:anti-sigma factor RsiW
MTDDRVLIASDDCDAVEPFLSAFIDGELFGADQAAVQRHVAGCGRCRAAVEEYRQWGPALREAVDLASRRDLSDLAWPPEPARAPSRSSPALTPRRRLLYDVARWSSNPWPVFAGSAALIALLVGIGLWRPAAPERLVEIERLDAEGPVMVFTADEGRTAIIWLSEPEERLTPEPTPL